ncbi:membrane protein [Oceanobacillus oncorhynchi subsp. incaldanensis]|uniref:DUF2975 domain-containing protein n=3 Tax=Bacillaceae TaxID=186817 RepID=A0A0A1MTT8_9BACI|nr:DUF2975 domain-containing protein [Oceanobacillus oncorhynchi]MDM8102301.1 DUF2975 domain-containing protein [Oceanobacillus oncorhynchi]UUI42194.1 DUF2975 domain-containing protein [Oceanobacillus oncorhynchi]GIO17712.1 membrane protein [Oceanobacillus oncorhynchi subsp. incaldanensis]CEI83094.1 hypothetical protein BN997_02984 [Oceanobacillus oncorhynchi]
MQKSSTTFLKTVIYLMGLIMIALSVILIPQIIIDISDSSAMVKWVIYPIVIGVFLTTIPFYLALYQALKLLRLIDQNQTFSEEAVFTLKKIKQCALTITGIYILTMPFIYLFAEKDDAPGVIIIGMVPLFVSFVVAVFASLLQKLFKNALEIKTENDLTV